MLFHYVVKRAHLSNLAETSLFFWFLLLYRIMTFIEFYGNVLIKESTGNIFFHVTEMNFFSYAQID